MLKKKIFIGTAQILSNYGATNSKFLKNKKYYLKLLEYAAKKGVINYDTASGYNSENIIGEFIKTHGLRNSKICTKFHGLSDNYKIETYKFIDSSLRKINNPLHCIFFHSIKDIKYFIRDPKFFLNLKKNFPIKHIGFSIYNKKDIKNIKFKDQISLQIPINILNHEFDSFLLKNNFKNIYGRSLFLQGLLVNKKINKKLKKSLTTKLDRYFNILKNQSIDPLNININYVSKKKLDFFIFGIEEKKQLDDILKIKKNNYSQSLINKISQIFNKKDIDPRNW